MNSSHAVRNAAFGLASFPSEARRPGPMQPVRLILSSRFSMQGVGVWHCGYCRPQRPVLSHAAAVGKCFSTRRSPIYLIRMRRSAAWKENVMKMPGIIRHSDLARSDWPQVEVQGGWVMARPEPFHSFGNRVKAAWLVLTGMADAFIWDITSKTE